MNEETLTPAETTTEPVEITSAIDPTEGKLPSVLESFKSAWHNRLVRKPKPTITQARLEKLQAIQTAEDKTAWKGLSIEDKMDCLLGTQNGLVTDKDRNALLTAEARQILRKVRNKKLAAGGAYWPHNKTEGA